MRPSLAWRDGFVTFALDRRVVLGTLPSPPLVAVPGAPPWLRGVFNREGRAVAVVDCGMLAGLEGVGGPLVEVVLVAVAGGELGLAAATTLREATLPSGDADGFFDRLSDPDGTRLVSLERLVERIRAELSG